MADMSIGRVDQSRWKKLTPQEIIKEQNKGEEVPSEIVAWAEQMAAFSKIPDDVTYEQVDGDVGIEALDRLGIGDEENFTVENAQAPTQTEEPDAVKDPSKVEEDLPLDENGNPIENENPGFVPESEAEEPENEEFTLADTSITADNEEIRKRKARKGIQ